MAVDGYSITGVALCYTGTGGAGALELLGYTEDGVDIDVTENVSPIMTDLFGPETPQDFQSMGMVARITMPLIAFDRTVLNKVTGKGDRTTVGLTNTPGLVMGVAGHAFRLGIACPADTPWSFTKAIVRPGFRTRLGTKARPFVMEFFAWPFVTYTATTGKDQSLWTRTLV